MRGIMGTTSLIERNVSPVDTLNALEQQARTVTASVTPGVSSRWKVTFESEAVLGTLAVFAGILSLNGLDIVTANIHTSLDDRRVIDTFEVQPLTRRVLTQEDVEQMADYAQDVLCGRADIGASIAGMRQVQGYGHVGRAFSTEVVFDTDSEVTLGIRVRTADRPGLLYDIAAALASHGLRTRAIAVLTVGGVARDMFRVVASDGSPEMDPASRAALELQLAAICR